MADSKITALTSIGTITDPAVDPLVIVDVSDTSMAATGTTKKVTLNNLLACSPTATLASATITGDLTVKTNVLKVDTTNNRVGIGTASPTAGMVLDIASSTSNNFVRFTDGVNATGYLGIRAASGAAYLHGNNNVVSLSCSTSNTTPTEQLRITNPGVFEFLDGVGGTRMTLNATGLGVGASPTANCKLSVNGGVFLDRGATGGASQLLAVLAASSGGNFGQISNTGTRWALGYGSTLTTVGTEALIWDTSGNVGIGVTPSAGKGCLQLSSGINFPATQVASSDANTLDDYEEGTFTATLKGTVSDPTTPVTTTARYTKIGRVVTVTIQFSSVTTTGASGRIQIDGLPFTNNSSLAGTGSVGFNGMATFTGSPFASLSASSSTIAMFTSNSAGAYTAVTFNAGTTQDLWTSLTYTV